MLRGFTKGVSVDVLYFKKITFVSTIHLMCNPTLHAIQVGCKSAGKTMELFTSRRWSAVVFMKCQKYTHRIKAKFVLQLGRYDLHL